MTSTSLAADLDPHSCIDCSPADHDPTVAGCPDWCEIRPDRNAGCGHVAHRAAIWELPDRVELCVMQVVSGDPTDIIPATLPTLYFWSADDAVFSDLECAEMARAIRRAGEVLCGVNVV